MTHRFFVPDPDGYEPGQTVLLPAATAHQVRNVLRMHAGDHVLLLDDAGYEYDGVLTAVSRREVVVAVEEKRPSVNEPAVQISLYQSLLKRDNFEWVLQKGTELGVRRFVPLEVSRNVAEFKRKKLTRWRRIVTEAAEQSGRGRIPTIAAAVTLPAALTSLAVDCALMPAVAVDDRTVAAVLAEKRPLSVALFIGPEGGFAPAEVALAQQHGVTPVTLGPRILRAETAALVSATLSLYVLGELT